jgi:succinate-semialdehyde dehydrogenase/glutarate-semialdehyde dehydrogenase
MGSTNAGVLAGLAELVDARSAELEDIAASELPFPRHVVREDITLAIRRMHAMADVPIADRCPVGTVALALPGNAILSNPLAAIGASFLTGNHTVAKLPSARRRWTEVLAGLLREALPPGAVTMPDLSGRAFIQRALRDPETGVLAVFGDDAWAAGYEHEVRLSGTTFIFEGPGKDPFLVLEPAVAEQAARAAVRAGCYNSGQACTAPERFYVLAEAHDAFVAHAIAATEELGPVGTLAPTVAKRVLDQVDDALARGATVHGDLDPREVDGRVLLTPTVLTGVDHTMTVMRDETFGPLVPVCRVSSVDQAVTLAEDSPYGLSATVYGGDTVIHDRLARTHGQVFAGTTWLDNRLANPIAPYGGRKASGWVWAWRGNEFVRRDGPRSTLIEFTRTEKD